MIWIVVASLLSVEFFLALLVVQLVSRIKWAWLPWLTVVTVVSLVLGATCTNLIWGLREDLLSPRAPFPTVRLLALSSMIAPSVFLLLLGIVSLLRRSDRGLKIFAWPISLRTAIRGLAAAFAVSFLTLLINDIYVSSRIRAMQREAKTIASSVAPALCAASDNAVHVYAETMRFKNELSERELPDFREDVALLRDGAWTEYLSKHAALAKRMREGTQRSRYRAEIDWSNPDPLSEQHSDLDCPRLAMRLLHCEGRRALLDGNAELGFANAVALRRMAEQLADDPRTIARLLSCAADGVAGDLIEHWLYLHQPTAEDVSQLVRKDFEFRASLPLMVSWEKAERFNMLAQRYFGLAADAEYPNTLKLAAVKAVVLPFDRLICAGDDLYSLPLIFDAYKEFASLSYEAMLDPANAQRFHNLDRHGSGAIADSAPSIFYSPRFAHIRADLRRRLADFALVLSERALLDQIQGGASLSSLNLQPPIDLMSGKPLQVVPLDGGIVIYSFGEDGKDDGGSDQTKPYRYFPDDYTFCLGNAYQVRRLTPPEKKPEQLE